ncbi:DUF2339 domain-containing protein [Sphingomonas suaedae]|uniref:DUF2339 domain-containing protein n=1 Tax=Sphingomonas suaedae TaxID=2599297 RepID=A0A518RIN2_9SPHN|nr:DUF2339 domain-containing protein [Sphingomonas suaedae]QDX27326.1 DUF2339 domain-containing protein [Sphingomonas suaedae]
MDGILFLAVVALGIVAIAQGQRVRALTRRIEWLEHSPRAQVPPVRAADPAPTPATTVDPGLATDPALAAARAAPALGTPAARRADAPPPVSPASAPKPDRPSLESLIGARLPVWIGAVALVVAGFFLVRHSIEIGLLGPGVRTLLAALFAAALVAASEAARRLPALRDDSRIGQALAGAGIASSYATLYIAAAIYRFIGPLPAFGLMLAVTALGLALALRHGPPTAILALAGGFVAPLVAGYDAAGIGPLLTYLALFTAALFLLAIHRRWAWLAIAATVAAFAWVNFLLFALGSSSLAAPAAFVVLLAIAATIALPRAGATARWLHIGPLFAGLIQLFAFAPALAFDALLWGFYLVLAAATLLLAWRDARYLSGSLAALGLALVLLGTSLIAPERGATLAAAPLLAALFAVPGLLLLDRGRSWAILAIGGLAGPVLLANLFAPGQLASWQWAVLELAAAALAAWTSWRRRAAIDQRDPGLIGGALAAAILAATGIGQLLPFDWIAVPLALATLALGLWARRTGDRTLFALPVIGVAAMVAAAVVPLGGYVLLIAESIIGETLPARALPALADALRTLLPPVIAVALLAPDRRQFAPMRAATLGLAIAIMLMLVYHFAKLPLAVLTEARFLTWGFVERMLVTQALFAAAWLLRRRTDLVTLATALFALAAARFLWFDLVIFNPVLVEQHVGSIPLLNAAVFHVALAAFWAHALLPRPTGPRAAMVLTFLAVLALVRQAAHGSLLTGPIGTGETYGYSAALLILALVWLALGIRRGGRDLRLAGLALLTGVTLKVFLIDAAALDGLLRILSFLGLGIALIGIGWVYTRFLAARPKASVAGD